MISDDPILKLGQAQQKVMILTVQRRMLEERLDKTEARAETLEALVMDIVADIKERVPSTEIQERIAQVMHQLDDDEEEDQ